MATLVHVRLFVRDPARMREFYEEILGFEFLGTDGQAARFRTGGTELVLEPDPPFADADYRDFINQLKGNMRGMGASLHFDVSDVDAHFAALIASGLLPIDPERNRKLDAPIQRPNGRREFAVEDPEGYWLFFGTPPRT